MMSKKERAMILELVEWIEECGEATARTEPMLDRARAMVRKDIRDYTPPKGKTLIEVLTETPK